MEVGDKVAIFNAEGKYVCYPLTSPTVGDKVVVAPGVDKKYIAIKGGIEDYGTKEWELVQNLGAEEYATAMLAMPSTMLAGTGRGSQVWRSADAGNTWTYTGYNFGVETPIDSYWIWKFLFVSGGIALLNSDGGVGRTTDYGVTWSVVTGAPGGSSMDTDNAGTVIAASRLIRVGFTCYVHIYRSTNYGQTFTWVQSLSDGCLGHIYDHVHFCNSGVVLCTMASVSGLKVYRSTNNGVSFVLGSTIAGAECDSWLNIGNETLLGGAGKIYSSLDSGLTWTTKSTLPSGYYVLALYKDGSRIYAGCDGNIFYSDDDGTTWTLEYALPVGNVWDITKSSSGRLYCCTSTNGQIWRRKS